MNQFYNIIIKLVMVDTVSVGVCNSNGYYLHIDVASTAACIHSIYFFPRVLRGLLGLTVTKDDQDYLEIQDHGDHLA